MPKLAYKTRGNSSPQRKPKVYFCCHPEDFGLYFEEISEDILSRQNCAVWYLEGLENVSAREVDNSAKGKSKSPTETEEAMEGKNVETTVMSAENADGQKSDAESMETVDTNAKAGHVLDDELILALESMQLFVVPVTSKFLYQKSRAREVEFAFAIEHHIPVLPLLQESGLESEFSRICGNLQVLNKYNKDDSAINFSDKLDSFLSSVLVSDEMAERVRNAFDAYAFLSYRKKDRKLANQLMRLIHKNEECRDIAIWYDEYLVPGENYNAAIEAAMKKSSLFTLLVTPNLINEDNYVKNVEYPAAIQLGMKVLPVEMKETDSAVLKDIFERIPDCVKPEKEDCSESFARHFRNLVFERQNRNQNKEHIFLIGIAYLNGIDVEVDHDRAACLIQSAADAGYEEAVEKMSLMYQNGEGVAQDYRKAVKWQEKLVQIREENYLRLAENLSFEGMSAGGEKADSMEIDRQFHQVLNGEESGNVCNDKESYRKHFYDVASGLVSALDVLGRLWTELQDFGEMEAVYQKMESYCIRMQGEVSDVDFQLYLSGCLTCAYTKIGDAYIDQGDYQKAYDAYLKNKKVSENIAVAYGCADLCKQEKAQENVDICCNQGEAQNNACIRNQGNIAIPEKVSSYLLIAYERLGKLFQAVGKYSEAAEFYYKAYEIGRKALESDESLQSKRQFSICCEHLGFIYLTERKFEHAEKYFRACYEIEEKIYQEDHSMDAKWNLAEAYCHMGMVYLEGEKLDDAENFYRRGQALFEEIVHQTVSLEKRKGAIGVYVSLGFILVKKHELDEAEKCYQNLLKTAEDMAKVVGSQEVQRDLSIAYEHVGMFYAEKGDLGKAKQFYLQSLEITQKVAESSQVLSVYYDLVVGYMKLGDICMRENDLGEADRFFKISLLYCSLLVQKPDASISYIRAFGICSEKMGDVSLAAGRLEEAYDFYKKSYGIQRKIVGMTGSEQDQKELGMCEIKMVKVMQLLSEKE